MIDGELDPASVRRVMVHSDVCAVLSRLPRRSSQSQLRAHRELAETRWPSRTRMDGVDPAPGPAGPSAARAAGAESASNSRRILYELGQRLRADGDVAELLTRGGARTGADSGHEHPRPQSAGRGGEAWRPGSAGTEWVTREGTVRRRGDVRTPAENMAKGKRLLNEGLMVLDPEFHEARIYLGHAYHVSEQHDRTPAASSAPCWSCPPILRHARVRARKPRQRLPRAGALAPSRSRSSGRWSTRA